MSLFGARAETEGFVLPGKEAVYPQFFLQLGEEPPAFVVRTTALVSFPWHRTEQEFSAGGWYIREA